MATSAVLLKLSDEGVVAALHAIREKLERTDGELVLDFSSVRRVDAAVLRALEELAQAADENAVGLTLRSVSVDVYKVLKLVKLAPRFGFLN